MARITFSTMYDTTMRNMQLNANKLNKLNEQIASEKMINRPSDNPVGFTNALNYRNVLNALGQHRINMNDGEIFMTTMETAHQSMNGIFTRSQELAVQASNDTEQHEQRLFTNLEIRQNLEQLVSIAQSKHKGNFMFSGKWTNQPPYEIKTGEARYTNPNNPPNPPQPITVNPPPGGPGDPGIFAGRAPATIQLFDGAFTDPNIKPVPDNPMVQRIIPGSVELNGLLETPNKNKNLDPLDLDYDKPDYEIDYVNGTITLFSERAKAAFYNNDGTAKAQDDMPPMSFEYVYRNSIDMSGEIFRELDSGITMKINANPDDLFGKPGRSDTDAFKEMISLMQGLWHNDQPQIAQSIENIDTARKRNLAEQAIEGARQNRLGIVYDRNEYLKTNNMDADARLEDVDVADVLTKFSMADAVYNASLQSAAMLMRRSLMDYL